MIEVGLSTATTDRKKAAVYARGGVAELWLVDIEARDVTVLRAPRPDGIFGESAVYAEGGQIPLPCVCGVIRTAEIPP